MTLAAHDIAGRRYLQILPFDDGPVKRAFAEGGPAQHCCECGAPIIHGTTRYFQRNDPMPLPANGWDRAMFALEYDPVCGRCGDLALAQATVP